MENVYKTILVALDGSIQSEVALRRAVDIASKYDSRLILSHVVDDSAIKSYAGRSLDYEEIVDEKVLRALDEYIAFAKENGVNNVESIVRYGSPRNMLAETLPEEEQVDLILMGATGTNAFSRVLMGSVAEHVVRQAICDVTIVRNPEDISYDRIRSDYP